MEKLSGKVEPLLLRTNNVLLQASEMKMYQQHAFKCTKNIDFYTQHRDTT